MIQRTLKDIIKKDLFKGKAILLFGPRQSGKSTLIPNYALALNRYFSHLIPNA